VSPVNAGNPIFTTPRLVHLLNQSIDVLFTIAQVTALNEMLELPCLPATSGIAQLERPEEAVSLFEVRSDGEDLVDQVLHAHDAVLAKALLDDGVIRERNALFVDLAIATLVDELSDGL
jgi:hypothetical protein